MPISIRIMINGIGMKMGKRELSPLGCTNVLAESVATVVEL